MTVAHLIERLQARPVTPVTPTTGHGVTAQNTPISLVPLVKPQTVTPVTPVTPKKVEGQSKNQKSPPDWTPPPPAPDPGMARLLALAMALCDRTGASEKERQDWRADIEQTPPGLRGGLYAHLLGQLPPAPKVMPPAVVAPPDPAKPLPKFHVAQPWNEADKAYQAHHWNCPTCKAAARSGHSDRCATGQQLHDLYERAFEAGKVSK